MRAAQRGFGDLQQDVEKGQERAQSSLVLGSSRLGEDYGTNTGRVNEDFTSNLQQIMRNRQRGTEDYQTATGNLQRGYRDMGERQTQTAVNQGVVGGGALAMALARRTENQGREQGQLDVGNRRFMEDSSTQETGLRTSFARALQDAEQQRQRALQDMGTDYAYGSNDRAAQQARAGRELGFYGEDIGAQRFFQAGQSGWSPPGRGEPGGPRSNEFRDAKGPYLLVKRGNRRYKVRPNGREERV
jgi:hypothetical protein